MDLSKAFDCLPHDLLILNLEAYGLYKSALNLMYSYLSERKQCVKVSVDFSTWKNIYKGVPQWSILGLVLFNIFLNDIFNFVEENILYNYADDNTLSYSDHNQMKANPDKFQAIAIGSKTSNEGISFNLDGNKIDCEKEVKLLGVTIDCQLKLNSHISNICKKASRQLNVLKRIGLTFLW
jgi:hypothetical protein